MKINNQRINRCIFASVSIHLQIQSAMTIGYHPETRHPEVYPQIQLLPVPERVSAYVKTIWQLGKGSGSHHERLFPTGETQLIFHYGTPFSESYAGMDAGTQPQSLICGQFTAYKDIFSFERAGLLGVVFHPFASNALFGIPAHYFTHLTVGLSDIECKLGETGRRVAEAPGLQERLKIIEDFIVRRLHTLNQRHFAMVRKSVELLSLNTHESGISKVANELFIGNRQFERLFKDYVGLSPERYAGIVRFNKALSLFDSPLNLTEIALESGYYDQAHFIRDFRRITGGSPSVYRNNLALTPGR